MVPPRITLIIIALRRDGTKSKLNRENKRDLLILNPRNILDPDQSVRSDESDRFPRIVLFYFIIFHRSMTKSESPESFFLQNPKPPRTS